MMIAIITISTAMIRRLSLLAKVLFFMGIGFYLSQQVQI